jgi:hypothetical protein
MKFTFLAAVAAIALASPATAKDIQLTLNDQQQAALLQVLDKATRDGGLGAANNGTVYFFNLLKSAVDAANAPPPPLATPAPAASVEAPAADAPK